MLPDMPERNGPVRCKVLERRRLVPQRPLHGGDKSGGGPRVPRSEERDSVAAADQLLGQRADNPLGTAVAGGRNALERWRDLGNAHARLLFGQGFLRTGAGAKAPTRGRSKPVSWVCAPR